MTLDTIILREVSPRQVSYAITYERESHSVMSTLCEPCKDYTAHGILQARRLEWVAFPFSRGSSQPRDWTQVSHMAGGFFYQLKPQGKAKNAGVGSLSLLQRIVLTQESDRGLLNCRRLLYQLNYAGRPRYHLCVESKTEVSEYNRKAVDSSIWGIS